MEKNRRPIKQAANELKEQQKMLAKNSEKRKRKRPK